MNNPLTNDLNHILSHTEGLWEDLRGQHLFVTGGTGFFGCWLLESFAWANDNLNLGASALVLTRDPDAFRRKSPRLASHPSIQLHKGDVRSFEFPEGEYSHIIHAAIQGTRHVLDFALYCGASRFLLTSSGAVYDSPLSDYGKEKVEAERLCGFYAKQYGIETMIARCFAFVGPYLPLDAHFAIGNFIRDAMRGDPIQVKGDGTPYRSYLYAADLALWLWMILLRGETCYLFRCETCGAYNVGSAEAVTIAELARLVAQTIGIPGNVKIAKTAVPRQSVECYIPDVQKTETELKLHQWIGLPEAITRTARWYKAIGEKK
jgi:nucleoside-diphosphate-sugar epimerase